MSKALRVVGYLLSGGQPNDFQHDSIIMQVEETLSTIFWKTNFFIKKLESYM